MEMSNQRRCQIIILSQLCAIWSLVVSTQKQTNKQKNATCILSIYSVVKRSSTLSSSGPPQTSFISCTSFNIFSPLSILVCFWFIGLIWDAKQLPVSASSGDPSQRGLGSNSKIWSFDMEIDCTIFSVFFLFFLFIHEKESSHLPDSSA